jgi:Response regulator containing a CheY-like receiver domain and an HTH DNA-binding domain
VDQFELYRALSCVAAAAIAATIVLALRREEGRLSSFVGFLSCVLLILVFGICELSSESEQWILLFSHCGYVAVAFAPVFWLLFAIEYRRGGPTKNPWPFLALSAVPAATSALSFLDGQLKLIWTSSEIRSIGGFSINVVLGYGPWFWLHFIYSYGLFFLGSLAILMELFGHFSIYRRQAGLVLAATGLPLAFNLGYVFRLVPGLTRDFSPLVLALSGLLLSISIAKYRLLDLNPPRPDSAAEYIDEGLAMLDDRGRVRYCNSAASRILGRGVDEIVGARIEELLPACTTDALGSAGREAKLLTSSCPATGRALAISVKSANGGAPGGVCLILRPEGSAPGSSDLSSALASLSDRELEVVRLFAEGLSQRDIAQRVYISENTVKTHLRHAYRKLGVSSKQELTELMGRAGEGKTRS